MWGDWVKEILEHHRGKVLGSLAGLVFALLVLIFGPLRTAFILISVFIGYQIGRRLDDEKEDIMDFLDRYLPPGHR